MDIHAFTWDAYMDRYKFINVKKGLTDGTTFDDKSITALNIIMTTQRVPREGTKLPGPNDYHDESEKREMLALQEQDGQRLVRRYNPYISHPNLYRKFSELGGAEENILEFANEYGLLSRAKTVQRYSGQSNFGSVETIWVTENAGYETYVESLEKWYMEVFDMQCVLEVVDALKKYDIDLLKSRFEWRKDGSVLYESDGYMADPEERAKLFAQGLTPPVGKSQWVIHAKTEEGQRRLEKITRNDVVAPALMFVQSEINKRLREGISPALLLDQDYSGLKLYYMPEDLRSLLWLQVAQEVSGQITVNRCEVCGNEIPISFKPGSRRDRKYCKRACSQKAYRERKKQASN